MHWLRSKEDRSSLYVGEGAASNVQSGAVCVER